MSSTFERSPQAIHSLAAAAAPRPWTKLMAAFAAGVASTALVAVLVAGPHRTQQAQQSGPARTEVAARAPSVATPAPSRPAPAPPAQTSGAAPRPEHGSDSAPATAAQANEPSSSGYPGCAEQTWPYVNHQCGAADEGAGATRSVRVITTDRSAPATVTTAAPRAPKRTTDGSATGVNTAGPGVSQSGTNAPAPDQVSIALHNDVAVDPSTPATAAVDVPIPRARPDSARGVKASSQPNAGKESRPDAAEDSGPDAAKQAGSAPTARERRNRSDQPPVRRSVRHDTTRTNGQTRRDKNDAEEEAAGVVRRVAPLDDDDETTFVRYYRGRDGRRLVREKPADAVQERPAAEERQAEQRPGFPFPFFLNPGRD